MRGKDTRFVLKCRVVWRLASRDGGREQNFCWRLSLGIIPRQLWDDRLNLR